MPEFEKQVLRMIDPPASARAFVEQLCRFYEQLAQGCAPTPVLTGRRALMEKALLPAFANPAAGTPSSAIQAIVNSLSVFWLGVVVPGGTVTAFLGGPALAANLASRFTNPRATPNQVAFHLGTCFTQATAMVQYIIPPAGPLLMVPPPMRPWS